MRLFVHICCRINVEWRRIVGALVPLITSLTLLSGTRPPPTTLRPLQKPTGVHTSTEVTTPLVDPEPGTETIRVY